MLVTRRAIRPGITSIGMRKEIQETITNRPDEDDQDEDEDDEDEDDEDDEDEDDDMIMTRTII